MRYESRKCAKSVYGSTLDPAKSLQCSPDALARRSKAWPVTGYRPVHALRPSVAVCWERASLPRCWWLTRVSCREQQTWTHHLPLLAHKHTTSMLCWDYQQAPIASKSVSGGSSPALTATPRSYAVADLCISGLSRVAKYTWAAHFGNIKSNFDLLQTKTAEWIH